MKFEDIIKKKDEKARFSFQADPKYKKIFEHMKKQGKEIDMDEWGTLCLKRLALQLKKLGYLKKNN